MENADELRQDLIALIIKFGLESHSEKLLSACKPSIGLSPMKTPDEQISKGRSKLGGLPDTPEHFRWPKNNDRYLAFVAQINLEEAASCLSLEPLPSRGLLSFFYDDSVWGFDPKDRDGFRVYYFNQSISELQRQEAPQQKEKAKFLGIFKTKQRQLVYKSCLLEMKAFLSLPEEPPELQASEEQIEQYFELLEAIGNHHRLLGFAEPIQGAMQEECALVSQGLYCGDSRGYKDPRAKEIIKTAKDWRLLLQIDSESEESDMMWGDAGRLYFWIKHEHLLAQDFAECWLISQCF